MGNVCCSFSQIIQELKQSHREEIDYLKSLHYEETKEMRNTIENQKIEIEQLRKRISDLEDRSDKLLLDYYNLEQDYFKCKNQLSNSTSHLDSFKNIFSL